MSSHPRSTPVSAARRARLWVGALVFALLFVSTLGQVHRVLHAPGLSGAPAAQAVAIDTESHALDQQHDHADAQGHGGGWLGALFGIHSDAECRLYDQLSGSLSLPGVPLIVLPLDLPTAELIGRAGDFVARWIALFDARGPPGVRVASFL